MVKRTDGVGPPPCPPMPIELRLRGQRRRELEELDHAIALAEKRGQLAAVSVGHKLNADHSVAVATDVFFDEDMARCPVGVKVQLLGAGGVASYGVYNGRDPFWIGWAPVPKRRAR